MENNFVICIGRQYLSGGKDIGKMLAQRLGVAFYDSAMLRERAKALGIEEGIFDMFDESQQKAFFSMRLWTPIQLTAQ